MAWTTVIRSAMPPPHPRNPLVFAAFSVGLLANAVLPGRVGELARVAVLTRRLDGRRRGLWPMLVGTVFAHRVFDLVPVVLLVIWVLITAKIPGLGVHEPRRRALDRHRPVPVCIRQRTPRGIRASKGSARARRVDHDGAARARRDAAAVRCGELAVLGQCVGWSCQLLAVWATMRAFDIHEALPAAGLVLLLMNVATIVPLWPGNVGLVQAAIALPLVQYGVDVRQGLRLRARAAGDRGVGRRRRRARSSSPARGSRSPGCREMPGAVTADDARRRAARETRT